MTNLSPNPNNNKPYPKLTVSILGYRNNLMQIMVNSLIPHLAKLPDWELMILNHSGTQQEGMNRLATMWNGEFLLFCAEDWFFLPMAPQHAD